MVFGVVGQVILFYLLGNIKYRVCLLASGQPIFRGSSQREKEERFTTSVSILSYRILLTESGRRVDFLSGTLTFPYPLVGLHCTNIITLFLFGVVLHQQTTLGSNPQLAG